MSDFFIELGTELPGEVEISDYQNQGCRVLLNTTKTNQTVSGYSLRPGHYCAVKEINAKTQTRIDRGALQIWGVNPIPASTVEDAPAPAPAPKKSKAKEAEPISEPATEGASEAVMAEESPLTEESSSVDSE